MSTVIEFDVIRPLFGGHMNQSQVTHFFNPHQSDWLHARRMINAMDHAEQISAIAQTFYKALS